MRTIFIPINTYGNITIDLRVVTIVEARVIDETTEYSFSGSISLANRSGFIQGQVPQAWCIYYFGAC